MRVLPGRDVAARADWLELSLLISERDRLGKSRLKASVREVAPELGEDGVEESVGEILTEIRRRSRISGALYPFAVDRTAVVRRASGGGAHALYTFLALNSAFPSFREAQVGFSPGLVFEKIVALALRSWSGGEAMVFSDVGPDESRRARDLLERLAGRLHLESHPERLRRRRKDFGLDVATWRPFPDAKAGHPVLMCQCTIGESLAAKAREITARDWAQLLNISEGTLSVSLALPHVLSPDYERWFELRRQTDLVLDRPRLLHLLEPVAEPWSPLEGHGDALRSGLSAWAEA